MIDRGFVFLVLFTISFFAFSQSTLGTGRGALRSHGSPSSTQRLIPKQIAENDHCEKNAGTNKDGKPCRTTAAASGAASVTSSGNFPQK
jgi:hypothetical protein